MENLSNHYIMGRGIKSMHLNSRKKIIVIPDETICANPTEERKILSKPARGEYRIHALRVDSDNNFVITYDPVPEP